MPGASGSEFPMTSLDPIARQDTLIGGKYRLGPVIGSGGVATVYRATHLWTEREVAVKLLDPTLPHFERLREGFLREARATVQLDHPNVVDVLDMGEDDWETAYLVMELLQGPTLRDVLHERGRLSEEQTLGILLPLADALEKAHQLGIVHRDFKPENIMLILDAYGVMTPKLLDFGVAEILQDARTRSLSSDGGVIMGTPQYMSPEQARDERAQIGPHTDVWGMGVVWYECLTGHAPFDGESATEILTAVCEDPIDFEAVPAAYVPLLRDALGRTPDLRIGSLSELKVRIEEMGIARSSLPPTPASLSSLPAPSEADEIPLTLSRLATRKQPSTAIATTQTETDLVAVPVRSNRGAWLAGIALTVAVAMAAWWTVRGPGEETTRLKLPEFAEPTPWPAEPLEEIAAEPLEEVAAEPLEEVAAEPLEEVAAEVEPQASKPPPRKPRRKRTPKNTKASPKPPVSDDPQYHKPPELVTEW